MCDCKKTLEQKLSDKYKAGAPVNESEHAAELMGYGYFMNAELSGGLILKPKMDVQIKYLRKNKNGDLVNKTQKSFITFNYCPFCGEKIS